MAVSLAMVDSDFADDGRSRQSDHRGKTALNFLMFTRLIHTNAQQSILSASDIHVKRFKHTGRRTPDQDDKEEEDGIMEEENGTHLCNTSDDFILCHHDVHRTKLYVPDETTFSIPLKYVDAMMPSRT